MRRLDDLVRFYSLLDRLQQRIGGSRTLKAPESTRNLPDRGVYFFFEPLEFRRETGRGPRVVRVGTHGLGAGSRSTLRQRVEQHRGRISGGGNHRGSIFRLLVGQALLARGDVQPCSSWGVKGDVTHASAVLGIDREALVSAEAPVERAVTKYIGSMPFLWADVNDDPGPDSRRALVERNCIALLSNHGRDIIDPPSPQWLGRFSDRSLVGGSGLWNQRHVEETPDPAFLDGFETIIEKSST